MNRREFLSTVATAGSVMALPSRRYAGTNMWQFNCFTKHLQWLDYKETAEILKEAGYDGADLTVRPGGHVLPERVEDDLPKAVEAFAAAGLDVPMIVTAVDRADHPVHENVLRTAQKLGVKLYRMGYLSFENKLGIEASIEKLRPQMQELADLNREIGITGAYQNHAGTRIGGPVWDLRALLKGIHPQHLGIQYDIKHATVEGGHSWILGLKLVVEHINCLALKDFLWQKIEGDQWRDNPVPMGTGMTDYIEFFKAIKSLNIQVPITLHLEYEMPHQLLKEATHDQKKAAEIEVYKRDLEVTKELMKKSALL